LIDFTFLYIINIHISSR